MKFALAIVLVALGGCAAPVPAVSVSNVDLCRYTLYGTSQDKVTAEAEAARRGVDCRTYYPAITARQQQQGQALQDAANYFNPSPAPAPAMPITCRTTPTGNGSSRTVCQ